MTKPYPIIGAVAFAVGCAANPTASLGVRGPIGGETSIQPSATVGAGGVFSEGSKVLEASLEFDQTEDSDGPLSVNSQNLTARVGVGLRRGRASAKLFGFQRFEDASVSFNGSEVAHENVSLGGLGVEASLDIGKFSLGVRAEKSMWGDNDPNVPAGAYGVVASYRF